MVSKLAWGIGWTFIKAHKSLKIRTLMGSFCPKCNNSARKFQRNFVSWNWKVMQNLKENWLVAWKMTRNLLNFHARSWKSDNLHIDWFFLSKAYIGSKNDMTNLVNFNMGRGKFKNLHFNVLLLLIVYKVSAKKV